MTTEEQDGQLRHRLATRYHTNRERMARGEVSMEEILEQDEAVVYAVWKDLKKPQGIDYLVIKGEPTNPGYVRVHPEEVVPCESEDEAKRFQRMND